MYNNIKMKITALCVLVLMLGNLSFGVAAIGDVGSTHWANSFIQTVVEAKIMDLYDNSTFKPNQNITNVEAIVVLYRSAKAAGLTKNLNLTELVSKYEKELEGIGIPKMLAPYGGDVYPALAYALENKILVMDEVKYFVSNGKLTEGKKVDITVFFGKALNVYKNENLNKIISLSFKDAFDISLGALKYVNLLIEYDIITSKGDSNGNFNPKSIINRSILAVYAEGYYKAIKVDGNQTNEIESSSDNSSSGSGSTNSPVTSNNAADNTNVNTNTVESVEEPKSTEVVDIYERIEGNFSSISGVMGEALKFRSLRIQLPNKSFDFKRVYDTTPVVIDGVKKTVNDLKEGYYLIVAYDGYDAKSIEAYSELYQFTGMLREAIDKVTSRGLEIQREDGLTFKRTLGENVKLNSEEDKLNKNDIVKVTMKYGVVTEIDYLGKARDVIGTIEEIRIKSVPEISIKLDDETVFTGELSKAVKIVDENGNDKLSVYDLRLNQSVRAHVGIGGVNRIDFSYEKSTVGFNCTVINVFLPQNLMVVRTENGEVKTVGLAAGKGLNMADYVIGDKLFIRGKQLHDMLFEAEAVIINKN